MKKNINTHLVDVSSGLDLFRKGIAGYYLKKIRSNRPEFIYLKLGDATIVKLYSTMNDLTGWDEIGSLSIEKIDSEGLNVDFSKVGEEWLEIKSISKLIFDNGDVRVECGLKINNKTSQAVVILPSSFPNAIELDADFMRGSFSSEYEVEEYIEELYVSCANGLA